MSQGGVHHLWVGVVVGWRWGGLSDPQTMLGIRSIANIIPNKLVDTKVNIIALLLLIITVQFWTFSGKIKFYQFGGRIFIFQATDLQDILNYSSHGCQQK